jgi:hypothetical protein
MDAALVAVMNAIMLEDPSDEKGKWSNYYRSSSKCTGNSPRFGKAYWVQPWELFARAFESYVFDWLKERGRRNDYLVHGVGAEQFADSSKYRGNPYPTGEERQRINAAMARLIEVWREAAA